jgi:hypothetical protein
MERRALVRLLQGNETSLLSMLVAPEPRLAKRYGTGASRRAGVVCVSARAFPIPLLHRAIGFGTLAPADRKTLDAVIRHYAALGLPVRIELADVAGATAQRLLERAGFEREHETHHVHVLEASEAPAVPQVPGLVIERVTSRTAKAFGAATAKGFEVEGTPLGTFFDEISVATVRRLADRATALLPRVDGEVAGTGLVWLSPRVAGLYSGSVFTPFRGRGIQNALIAERVRLGLARRRRIFTSQTEGDNPSAHNLHEMGFRTLYSTAYYLRQA